MKNLLLFSISLTASSVWGAACTTAVGSTHVIATCALGDRTFSAFATFPDATNMVRGQGRTSGGQTEVLVPLAEWAERSGVNPPAHAVLDIVDSATPQRADHGLNTALAAVSSPPNIFDGPESDGGSGLVPQNTSTTPTLVLPPTLGSVEEKGAGPVNNPPVTLSLADPTDHLTETPEPATYASIGFGLIGLWFLGRRAARRSQSD